MYVYLLRSQSPPSQTYVGLTTDIQRRLEQHNGGESVHTSKYVPWKIESYIWFSDGEKALKFEKYLKSGSGLAFRQRHF